MFQMLSVCALQSCVALRSREGAKAGILPMYTLSGLSFLPIPSRLLFKSLHLNLGILGHYLGTQDVL